MIFFASLAPTRAQALHGDLAAAEFAELEPASEAIALADFQRYSLVPCESPAAPTRSTKTPITRCAAKNSAAPRYHLNTTIDFSPGAAPAASRATPSPDGEDADAYSSALTSVPVEPTLSFSAASPAAPSYFSALAYQDRNVPHAEGFHWWPALEQSFYFLLIEHGFRIADDPYLRYLLWHKPFWHDYVASTRHFYMNQWGDGDDFIVNYIGHPMEGGVTGNIQILNDPRGRSLTFGKSRAYWTSRLKAMAFSAAYSAQFEAGPILS
jgi:hypothetical protein